MQYLKEVYVGLLILVIIQTWVLYKVLCGMIGWQKCLSNAANMKYLQN